MDALTAPAIDQHCHSLWRDYRAVDVARFRQGFSESSDSAILTDHLSNSLGYRRELALLAELYNCASDEAAILRARASLRPADLLHRANVVTLLVDCGVATDTTLSLMQLQEVTGIPCHEILRIETIAQDVLATADNFEQFGLAVRRHLLDTPGVVAFKSIIGYRAGLDVQPLDQHAAEASFNERPSRLAGHALGDWVVDIALECAQMRGVPVQFHCGWGDSDEDLRLADPLFLRPLIVAHPRVPVVLLHCYPYHRHAAYLAAMYANVYIDLSLTFPHIADPLRVLAETVELCPASKLLYASDALGLPEIYWLGAQTWRQALAQLLPQDLSELILNGNAKRLYGLS